MRRFMICVNDTTTVQQNVVTTYFQDTGKVAWWHYYSDIWLIKDPYDIWDTDSIRNKIMELLPGMNSLVLQVDSTKWSAFGIADQFKWLHESWAKD